jgi:hypothetical protein
VITGSPSRAKKGVQCPLVLPSLSLITRVPGVKSRSVRPISSALSAGQVGGDRLHPAKGSGTDRVVAEAPTLPVREEGLREVLPGAHHQVGSGENVLRAECRERPGGDAFCCGARALGRDHRLDEHLQLEVVEARAGFAPDQVDLLLDPGSGKSRRLETPAARDALTQSGEPDGVGPTRRER